jgi:hypothetical protein
MNTVNEKSTIETTIVSSRLQTAISSTEPSKNVECIGSPDSKRMEGCLPLWGGFGQARLGKSDPL